MKRIIGVLAFLCLLCFSVTCFANGAVWYDINKRGALKTATTAVVYPITAADMSEDVEFDNQRLLNSLRSAMPDIKWELADASMYSVSRWVSGTQRASECNKHYDLLIVVDHDKYDTYTNVQEEQYKQVSLQEKETERRGNDMERTIWSSNYYENVYLPRVEKNYSLVSTCAYVYDGDGNLLMTFADGWAREGQVYDDMAWSQIDSFVKLLSSAHVLR